MIIYSVTVCVADEVVEDWECWMNDVHIPDVMATGFFRESRFARIVEPSSPDDRTSFRIDYFCDSMSKYEQYRDTAAAALQSDHTRRYEGRFEASRQILVTI